MKKTSILVSTTVIDLLQYRIKEEEQSSRTYLGMSMRLSDNGYSWAAKLFLQYSKEELVHADKARDMLLAHGVQPQTPALMSPKEEFIGLSEIVRLGYEHEVEITKQCQQLAKTAFEEQNYMVAELAMRLCKEQVEELDKFQNRMDRLSAFWEDNVTLRMLDEEMWNKA